MKNSLKKIMLTIVMLVGSTAQVQLSTATAQSDWRGYEADTGDYEGPSERDLDKKIASDFDKLVAQLNAEYEKSLMGQDLSRAIEMQDKKYINSNLVASERLGSYLLLIAEYLHRITIANLQTAYYEILYDWLTDKEKLQTAKEAKIADLAASIIPVELLGITPPDVIDAMKNDAAWEQAKKSILATIAEAEAARGC